MAPAFDNNQPSSREESEKKLTIPRVEGGPQDPRTPLIQMSMKFPYEKRRQLRTRCATN